MPLSAAAIKEQFRAEFGDDDKLWAQFQRHVQLAAKAIYKTPPVTVREFFTDPYYCGEDLAGTLFPEVMKALEECCSGKYVEAVLTGGIGVSKTTIALLGTMYQVYLLSCMWSPQRTYGLMESDEIVFIFQSLAAHLAKAVDFERFKERIQLSPYFMSKFRFNKDIKSELHFPHRIIVKPVSGDAKAAISQNVFGGLIDEVNFMAVIQKSKRSIDGDGGTYDQAKALYESIRRRRESRFMSAGGELPGLLFLVSSKRYPGQFTDKKADESRAEIKLNGFTRIYIYDKKIWEVKPHAFGKERFRVFVGDQARQPYILKDEEKVSVDDAHLVIEVPTEYRISFDIDIMGALRDIGGSSTLSRHPFIIDTTRMAKAFGRSRSVLNLEATDFQTSRLEIYPNLFRNPKEPRAVHIDLGITGDSAGVSCGYVPGFAKVPRAENYFEQLPVIDFDFVLEVMPPRGGEIIFAKIRTLIFKLRELGLNIRWITLDTFQSRDTLQIMRTEGFATGLQSVDTTVMPYTYLKTALMDERVLAPKHARAQGELAALEQDASTGKIDHPEGGSKDCSDAMAGVAHCLTTRREIWVAHNMLHLMPESFTRAGKDLEKKPNGSGGDTDYQISQRHAVPLLR